MKYRFLGNSGLQVSRICYGAMTFTGGTGWTHLGSTGQEEADRLVSLALDNGVNFFDTADIYSDGVSEEMLGKALTGKRNSAVITTKCGFKMNDSVNGDGHSRRRIIEACEASLKRLNTDYIDLYLLHSYDFTTPFEEFLSALDMLVKEGKIRYAGASNFFAWQLMKADAVSERHGWTKFINLQAYYSLLGRDIETEIVPCCVDRGIGITVWSPLHGGILSGKYRDKNNFPEGTRLKKPGDHLPYNIEQGEKILDILEQIALSRGITISQAALSWTLSKPGITSIIAGARNERQLLENINSASVELSSEEIKLLDETSKPQRTYPNWYFNIFRKERMERYFNNLYRRNDDGI